MPTSSGGVKFSQFLQAGNINGLSQPVGLQAGVNAIFAPPVNLVYPVNQVAHGFDIGNILTINSMGVYRKAQADVPGNSNVVGIVANTPGLPNDADNFILIVNGLVTGLDGLIPGTTYFLSAVTAGGYTQTAPSGGGQVRKVLFTAISPTEAVWFDDIGQVL